MIISKHIRFSQIIKINLNLNPMKTKTQIFLTTLFILLISATSEAQVNFGIRSGLAATTFSNKGNLLDDTHVTCSYTGGVFASFPVIQSLNIQFELNYVRKGRSNETTELNTSQETDFMIHYLQIPVLIQYQNKGIFNKSGSIFFINAGPYAALPLATQTRNSGSDESNNEIQSVESKKTDWGASFGIGFQTPIMQKNICFDLRYDMGCSEIEKQPEDYRTKALNVTVGIVF